jgi:thiamine pyrophosphokinase
VKAVVVAHGDVAPSDRELAAGAELVIAADGGAFALERWGIVPHVVVGDLDSLGEDRAAVLERSGATVVRFPIAKDASDLELAMRYAIEHGADDILLLGIQGGARIDHALVNVSLLADPAYRGLGVRAVYGDTQLRTVHSGESMALRGPVGSTVTLVPMHGDARGVTTHGLRYPLTNGTLPFGRSLGLSNVVATLPARVSVDHGALLIIEIAKEEAREI